MNNKRILTLASFISIVVVITRFTRKYLQWKRKVLQDLASNSSIIDTAIGAVEYSAQGKGPAILFSHGTPAGYDQSLATANMLKSDHFTYIAVSRPGYLRTPLHQKSPAAQADLYAALLDRLGIQKTAIIGTSGGGPSALQFALRYPERCSALIMVCGVSQQYSEHAMLAALPPLQHLITPLLGRFVYFNNPILFLVDAVLQRFPYPLVPEGFVLSLTMPQLRKVGYANDIEQFEHINAYPVEQIAAPTLVLHGNRDKDVPIKHAQYVVSKIPHAQFVIDEKGNHNFYISHRKKIVPLILEFLVRLPEGEGQDKL